MAGLPEDVVADILSRLPVKSLLRFRCVSKPWRALVDSPNFIKSHLHRSIATKTYRSLVISQSRIHSSSLDSLGLSSLVELQHPLSGSSGYSQYTPMVLGSCDGLLLLCRGDNNVAIWNPSTKKYRILPEHDYTHGRFRRLSYCLGYDSVSDDYKVVRLNQYYVDSSPPAFNEVGIYSLKSNSWQRVQDLPHTPGPWICGVFVSGVFHWDVIQKPEACSIAASDLETEEYRSVPLPKCDWRAYMNLAVLEGCVCFLCSLGRRVDVWVLKEYGVEESWTRLCSFAQTILRSIFEPFCPLAYSIDSSKVLFVEANKFYWFDLERNVAECIDVSGLPEVFESEVYVHSLVRVGCEGDSDCTKPHVKDAKKMKTNHDQ